MQNERERRRLRFNDDVQSYGTRAATRVGQGSNFQHFCSSTGRGSLAYADLGWAWVGAGEPAVDPSDALTLVREFMSTAKKNGRLAVLFDLSVALCERTEEQVLFLGQEPLWLRDANQACFSVHRRLREQAKRAQRRGVRVESIDTATLRSNLPMRRLLHQVHRRWVARHNMPALAFVVAPSPLEMSDGAVLRVAIGADETLLGYAFALWSSQHEELYLKDLVRDPAAPNGTPELLIESMFAHASTEGATRLSLGIVPLSGPPSALRTSLKRLLLPLYSFAGLETFRTKMAPNEWRPTLLLYPRGRARALAVAALLLAFCENRPFHFAARFVLRGTPAFLAVTALGLVPWTCLLACLPTKYVGLSGLQSFWVLFDIGLLGGFLRLLARPSCRLAGLMACAVSMDAFASVVEFGWMSAPGGALQHIIRIAAIAGPFISAISLWGSYHRLRRPRHPLLWQSPRKEIEAQK